MSPSDQASTLMKRRLILRCQDGKGMIQKEFKMVNLLVLSGRIMQVAGIRCLLTWSCSVFLRSILHVTINSFTTGQICTCLQVNYLGICICFRT